MSEKIEEAMRQFEADADSNVHTIDETGPLPVSVKRQLSAEEEADTGANPYGEESLKDIIIELMDSNKRLYAKSVLTEKEATVFGNLAAFSFYHKVPSLLRWVNRQLEYRMSIGGRRITDVTGPYGVATDNQRKKSMKDRIVEIS